MARILYVWELGANLGHIDRMLVGARALRARGHDVRFLLRDLARAHARVAAAGFALGQAPVWLPPLANPPRLANFSAVLAAGGWLDAQGLAALLCAWRDAFELAQPDVAICDHAPTALLALRTLDPGAASSTRVARRPIVRWVLSNSFELPPPGPHFPAMLLEDPAEPPRCPGYDATVLPHVQEALALVGAPPLERLTDVFAGAHLALVTLPELAHYDGYAEDFACVGPVFVGDVGALPQWPDRPADAPTGEPRVFAYLEPTHKAFDATMAALRTLGWPGLVHAKGLAPAAAERLGGPRLRFEPQPVQVSPAVAGADIVITHASLGTVSAAALAGKPQLVLPNHTEQSMVARRVRQLGIGLEIKRSDGASVPVQSLLQRLHAEPSFAQAARALAARHAGAGPAHSGERIADIVEASLRDRKAS